MAAKVALILFGLFIGVILTLMAICYQQFVITTKKKFKTDAFEANHESALALHSVGAIEKATMREFNTACLVKTPIYEAKQIKKIREEAKVSQPIMAIVGRIAMREIRDELSWIEPSRAWLPC